MVEIGLQILSEVELSEVIESGLSGLLGLVGKEVISDWSEKEDLLLSSSEVEGISGGVFISFLMDVEDLWGKDLHVTVTKATLSVMVSK